jgi:hypothetical protein
MHEWHEWNVALKYFEIFQLALKCSKYQSTWDTGTCLADNESVFFAWCVCVCVSLHFQSILIKQF